MNELEVLIEIEDIPHTEHVQDRVQLYSVQSPGHLFQYNGHAKAMQRRADAW